MAEKEEKRCFLCGGKTALFKKANYNMAQVDSYGFASRKVPEYMHYELRECRQCRVLMAVGAPDAAELSEKYAGAAFDSQEEAGDASRTYFSYLQKYLPNFPRGRALDIGTGEGSYLRCLRQAGVKEVVGVEPSAAPIEAADESIRGAIRQEMFHADRFEAGSFDMISCFQTVEHIPDPVTLVRDISSLLKEGGVAYMVCHDYRSAVNRLLGTRSPIYDIEHLQIFSRKSIEKLLTDQGFRDVWVFTLRNVYPLKYWARLFPMPASWKRVLLQWLEKVALGQIKVGINVGNVGVIARKK